jgi:hypothetical protein
MSDQQGAAAKMQDQSSQAARALAQEAHQIAHSASLDGAYRFIEVGDDPLVIALAYNNLAQTFYRQDKDVKTMIDAGRRGVAFALDNAARVESDAAQTVAKLKNAAKAISFNVGANTWPGWGDEGIEIAAGEREAGMEMALLSCRLAQELDLGQKQIGTSHWLLGAHQIAANCPEAAIRELDMATDAFASAGEDACKMMARGYRAMAQKLRPETRVLAQAELDQILRDLAEEGGENAKFFREQIIVADRILCGERSEG